MVLSEDGEESVLHRYEELCLDLNMDGSTKEEAWQNYQKIITNFSLEGDQVHWLACSLYEACRRTTVPTVGRGRVEGNCVSLTRLLRSSKFSLIQFFNKMRKWSDMAALPKNFRDKIDKLQRNFAVSTVIFKKYEPIFLDIFVHPAQDPPRQPRGRKQRWVRRLPCTSNEIFKFAWTMFVQVKGNFPAISDDLVNSYHLLLCCVDWIYANAILGGRRDLLNPDFAGLPEDFHRPDWKPDGSPLCIMQLLCETHDGLVVEAKTIKEHWWKPHIKRLFEKKLLKGKLDTLSAIFEIGSFEENVKMTNNFYEEYVLSVGDFDERIFLGDDAEEEIGTPGGSSNAASLSEQMAKRSLKQHFDETKSLAPSTPLTGRRYLKEKDLSVTPVSTATQSVSRLQALLSGTKTSPSDALKDIFRSCSQDPADDIIKRVKEMGELFCQHYIKSTKNDPGAHIDFARRRLQLGESLYFKALEEVTDSERRRLEGKSSDHQKVDLLALLENDSFHRSLFACCLEIVIFSYNSQRTFPWIVDIFELSPYQFYKVIEIIIRAEKGLSRDVVKHLNHIEESILESFAWRSDSPLWEAIKEKSIPKCGEVMPAHHLDANIVITVRSRPNTGTTPVHPRLRSLVADLKPNGKEPLLSPGPPSAADRFSSPSPGNAKRRLFAGPSVSTLPFSQPTASSGTGVLSTSLATIDNTTVSTTPVTIVGVGKSTSQTPTITVVSSGSQGAATVTGLQPGKVNVKSILRSQLKGGMSDTVLVSNKIASQLAPTTNDNLSSSSSPSQLDQDSSTNSNDSGINTPAASTTSNSNDTLSSAAAATVIATSTTATASSSSGGTSRPQQAIVAMMEDGRQILIPVQISQPSTVDNQTVTEVSDEMMDEVGPAYVASLHNDQISLESVPSSSQSQPKTIPSKAEMRTDHTYMMPKKTGSLSLFFRKVYHLASVRLRDLCEKLDLEDNDLIQKIWTCFEHGLVNHIHLMCDRHLDQLIMCSLYLIAKVTDKTLTFQNIMKCYRLQPQAQSHVYRSVLLQDRQRHSSGSSDSSSKSNSSTSSPVNLDGKTDNKEKEKKLVRSSSTLPGPRPSSQPPTPTQQSGSGSSFDFEGVAERGDLIMFYNLVFLKKIRYFALQFAVDKPGEQPNIPKISPMPAVRNVSAPSRRVSNQHSIYLWPHVGNGLSPSAKGLSYCINRSPSKDLDAINKMIRQVTWSSKRVLEVDRDKDTLHSPAKRPCFPASGGSIWMKRIQDLQGSMDGDGQH